MVQTNHVVQTTMSSSDLYVSIGQAATMLWLWVNRATIRRWLKEGRLKGKKIGRVTLIPKRDALAVMQDRSITSAKESARSSCIIS